MRRVGHGGRRSVFGAAVTAALVLVPAVQWSSASTIEGAGAARSHGPGAAPGSLAGTADSRSRCPTGTAAAHLASDTTPAPAATPEAPSASWNATDGSTHYVYSVSNGTESYATPTSGFNPLTASDAELASLNFPPRPSSGTALASWTAAMQDWRSTPAMTSLPVPTPGHGAAAATHTTSMNWAGTMLSGGTNSNEYSSVSGDYIEPNTTLVTSCNETYETAATWLGVGGWTSANGATLAQAGTNSYVPPTTSPGPNAAWFEFWPLNLEQGLNFTVAPGNTIYVSVGFAGASAVVCHDQGYAYGFDAYVEDDTSGTSNGATFCTNTAPNLDTAEWIDERPETYCSSTSNCSKTYLADFHATAFSSLSAVDQRLGETYGPTDLLGRSRTTLITMASGLQQLARPSTPANDAVRDTWLRCN